MESGSYLHTITIPRELGGDWSRACEYRPGRRNKAGKIFIESKIVYFDNILWGFSFNHDVLFSDTCQGRRSWPEEEQEQEGQARSQGGGRC